MDVFGKVALTTATSTQGATIILPVFVVVLPVVAILTALMLRHTLLGRAIFAVGGSSQIAERLGYNLRTINLFTFGYAGALAGLAGMIHTCSNRLSNPFDIVGSEIDVIAAVVLGVARLLGDRGRCSARCLEPCSS